ncbi:MULTISPECIES: arylesterase [Methylobacillus]|uniref:Arylesterase n=1 Tax=Methylobacillus flagellatus (strain ATCC 51484 / DSM 6875 / VKM B-1610 / KT) TaxID=265072 RepID=Q1H1W9_METFK|nr:MULTISPECIES: arylesterase [Methylobacillus]ABE49518.1 Arylesterase [Methylobacillus flagellatus KT]MPS47943.1 arylesterase [Methylobacillus sp.]
MMFRFILLFSLACAMLASTAHAATILVYGDSLSAAYGIPREQGWVALLEKRIAHQYPGYKVVNASISGETTSGGVSRIAAALTQHKPDIVILELGANDGLRGLPVDQMRNNLASMIKSSHEAKAQVLLAGMMIPPNYGPKYTREFIASYTELAKEFNLRLVPFLLEGVAGKPEFTQQDGLHPKANAQEKILENVWKQLEPLLKRDKST